MSGFKIICLKCGKEVVFTQDTICKDNGIVIYAAGYDGEIAIRCDCGNAVED